MKLGFFPEKEMTNQEFYLRLMSCERFTRQVENAPVVPAVNREEYIGRLDNAVLFLTGNPEGYEASHYPLIIMARSGIGVAKARSELEHLTRLKLRQNTPIDRGVEAAENV